MRRQLDLGKKILRVEIVVSGFVDHSHELGFVGLTICEHDIDLSPFERSSVPAVGYANNMPRALQNLVFAPDAEHLAITNEGMVYEGQRYRVTCALAGKP